MRIDIFERWYFEYCVYTSSIIPFFYRNLPYTLLLMSVLIAPSVLSADFGNLERDIKMINESKADWFHVDVMDGVFVPNISFGFPVLKAVKKHARKPLDVHLMIVNPDQYLAAFADAGASIISRQDLVGHFALDRDRPGRGH